MFTYVCLGTNDLARAGRFYDAALAPLRLVRCVTEFDEPDSLIGWGSYTNQGQQELALWLGKPFDGQAASVGNGTMVAFKATHWAQVDAFYAQALLHGGSSEGAPGLRLQYNPDFYAAYVRDPDGNKLAVVCRGFTTQEQTDASA
jgi:catechol 2,3-dioxygenase-like lactoylglutathione lyase family enzyme